MTKKLISAAFAVLAGFAVATAQAACEDNWKDCAGKSWVDGDVMDTPMGSIWWPHPIWGEGDQAGSTNWYKKPDVVMRALGAVKEGGRPTGSATSTTPGCRCSASASG